MAPRASPLRCEIRRLRMAMGTWVAFEVSAASVLAGQEAIDAAFAAVRRVEELMHPERAGSDIAALNAAPPCTPVHVDADTCAVLSLAKHINTLTAGVFDPCLATRSGRLQDLEIGADGTVICHRPVALDLGGIAKGYAVDRAVATLLATGCSSGLVNAGGDLRVFGPEAHSLFIRSVAASDGDTEFVPLELRETALAVSDFHAEHRPPEHRGYYVRDDIHSRAANTQTPRRSATSLPPGRHLAAVLAPDAAVADALAKCVLLGDERTTTAALQAFGASALARHAP